jgi:hypothetical protein
MTIRGITLFVAALVALAAPVPATSQSERVTASASFPLAQTSAVPRRGTYKGQTRQDRAIELRVRRKKVRRIEFTIRGSWAGHACQVQLTLTKPTRIRRSGRFRVATATGAVRGRFVTRKRAKGRIEHLPTSFHRCDAGPVRYSAHRV